jgi:molybdopterin converting factor subunit 1
VNSVRLLLFGSVKDIAAAESIDLPLSPGDTTDSLLDALVSRYPALGPWRRYLRVAVNREYAPGGSQVSPGDEVAVIPPVSGG